MNILNLKKHKQKVIRRPLTTVMNDFFEIIDAFELVSFIFQPIYTYDKIKKFYISLNLQHINQ